MGNEHKKGAPAVKMSTPAEIKTIVKCLKENNLDVAKAKMDSLIREEDYITVYDIIVPLLEILKERVTYIIANNECPPDLRAQLDSIIYASTRLEVEELVIIRDLIMRRYGAAYIEKADNNADRLVNINLVEKLKIKPASDAFLTIRLKQLCKEKKINYEFPSEIISDIPDPINNPFGPPSNNMGGGDINPYASVQGNNPYGQPPNNFNNNNPYGPPPGDNNPYGPPPGNNNPFGPPGDNNPYPPPGNNNPYGPPPDNNPFGPQQGNNNNPFGSQQGHSLLNKDLHQEIIIILMLLNKDHHQEIIIILMLPNKDHHQEIIIILMLPNKDHHQVIIIIHLLLNKVVIRLMLIL